MAENRLRIVISASARGVGTVVNGVRQTLQRTTDAVFSLQGAMVGLGGGMLARSFLETAAAMEKMEVQLTTIQGSAAAARRSMDWITEFATTTPYEIDQVTQSFVKLEAYGLKGTQWLGTLGDTASSMGKSLDQAVEMFADAVTGEFERLKEFGVKASVQGDQVAFRWSENGRDMEISAEKTQSGISSALGQVFDRFDGGMERMSTTWEGMVRNLGNAWVMFQADVMNQDVFINLKASIKTVIDLLVRWKKDGEMSSWAQVMAKSVNGAFSLIVKGAYWVAKSFLGWKIIWEGLKIAWAATKAAIIEGMALLVDAAADAVQAFGKMKGFFGMDTSGVDKMVASMRDFSKYTLETSDHLFDDIGKKGVSGLQAAIDNVELLDQTAEELTETWEKNKEALLAQGDAAQETADKTNKGIEQVIANTARSAREQAAFNKEQAALSQALNDVTMAVLPQQEQAIERVIQKYRDWNIVVWDLYDAAKISAEKAEELQDGLSARQEEALKALEDNHEDTADEVSDIWENAYDSMGDALADFFYDGKFELDDFADYFRRVMSEMAAADLMSWATGSSATSQLAGAFSSGGSTTSSLLSFLTGGSDAASTGLYGPTSTGGNLDDATSFASGLNSVYNAFNGGAEAAWDTVSGWFGGAEAATSEAVASTSSGFSLSNVSWAGWAGAAYIASSMAADANRKQGYGAVDEVGAEYQHGDLGLFGFDLFDEPISTYIWGSLGLDEPSATTYMSQALQEGEWGDLFTSSIVSMLDPLGIVEQGLEMIGIDLGGIFGYSNKERSYLHQDFYGQYDPVTGGFVESGSYIYKEKRDGEEFAEAEAALATSTFETVNTLIDGFRGVLGSFDESVVNDFNQYLSEFQVVTQGNRHDAYFGSTSDRSTEAPDTGITIGMWVGAEDSGEVNTIFNNIQTSITEGIYTPIAEQAVSLLTDALTEEWNNFDTSIMTDSAMEYFNSSFTGAISAMEIGDNDLETELDEFQEAASFITDGIMGYIEGINAITEQIDTTIASGNMSQAAIQIEALNATYDEMGDQLTAYGIDLEKYTGLEETRAAAIADVYAEQDAIFYSVALSGMEAMGMDFDTDVWLKSLALTLDDLGISAQQLDDVFANDMTQENLIASWEYLNDLVRDGSIETDQYNTIMQKLIASYQEGESAAEAAAEAAEAAAEALAAEAAIKAANSMTIAGVAVTGLEAMGKDFSSDWWLKSIGLTPGTFDATGEELNTLLESVSENELIEYWLGMNGMLDAGTIAADQYTSMMGLLIESYKEGAAAEQELLDTRERANQSIDDMILRLTGGDLAPVQSMEFFNNQYASLLSTAQAAEGTEDFDEKVASFTGFIDQLLNFSGVHGGDYASQVDNIYGDLSGLRSLTSNDFSDVPLLSDGANLPETTIAAAQEALGTSKETNVVVNVRIGEQELQDIHIDWHTTDRDTHDAVQREVLL